MLGGADGEIAALKRKPKLSKKTTTDDEGDDWERHACIKCEPAMDINASDPILVASQQFRRPAVAGRDGGAPSDAHRQQPAQPLQPVPSADVVQLCRLFLLDFYLKRLGKTRLFELLQREHERNNLASGRAFALLLACFLLTWLLGANYGALLSRLAAWPGQLAAGLFNS